MAAGSKPSLFIVRAVEALQLIARGRLNGGRPLAGEDARQLAREALTESGVRW